MQNDSFELHISVRGLVEFLLRNGDIDTRYRGGDELSAMQAGSRIHRSIQGKMGPDYQAEVPLFYIHENNDYKLTVEGRADGIITNDAGITIDEIKGTYRKLDRMKKPVATHIAQAKCYAYMYGRELNVQEMRIRLTYCNMETEEIRYFYEDIPFDELEKWFLGLIEEYDKWAKLKCSGFKERRESIEKLEFPYPYRDGQHELVVQVYQTIYHKKKLFLEAPTGVGKTISTIFPAIKAIGTGKADRLFYLTAKTITRSVACDTFELLRKKGLSFRSVEITAKEKICFCSQTECNPEACEYAKGHYDRVNEALYALLTEKETISRDEIESYAHKYRVCPFELTLDATLFADGIICDYNYLFDPNARLQRFFGDGAEGGNNIFLIDEAHNLLERGREMYSASLFKEAFTELKRAIRHDITTETNKKDNNIEGQLSIGIGTSEDGYYELTDNLKMEGSLEENTDSIYVSSGKQKHPGAKSIFVKHGYADKIIYQLEKCNKVLLEMKRECDRNTVLADIDELTVPLNRLSAVISEYLEERETRPPEVGRQLLEFYFDLSHFLDTYEIADDKYVMYSQVDDDGGFMVKLFCMDPSRNLKECMQFGISSILFSATFLPIQYYKKLLGGEASDYEVYAKSVFDPERSGVIIAGDVTSRYTRRNVDEFTKIAGYIDEIVHSKKGNYMVFCPSHSFMHHVFDIYKNEYVSAGEDCVMQLENMSESDREEFLELFSEDSRVTAFCVLGGIFGEGIDLKSERLIGSIIIGTGLPSVSFERELLMEHFDTENKSGFDYAYRFPGMNKVLQAAGRVIRTETDRGVIALLDDRFLQKDYQKLFPREWINIKTVRNCMVSELLSSFWEQF